MWARLIQPTEGLKGKALRAPKKRGILSPDYNVEMWKCCLTTTLAPRAKAGTEAGWGSYGCHGGVERVLQAAEKEK